jgi:glycosyltransferase involved in cell wall biosynthesis
MIVDFDDDFTNIPWWNSGYHGYQPGQELRESGLGHLRLAEATTVSTKKLTEIFEDKTHNIFYAPNCIDPVDWENLSVNPDREKDDALYILYGGAAGHFGDLDEIKEGIQAVVKKPPVNIRLICFGALPAWLHELSRQYPDRVYTLPWIPFNLYPQVVAWGGFNLAIAPLAAHPFNDAKSNIKWLEAGIQRIPFFCSDIGPYKDIPKECAIKVDNTPAQWAEGLRAVLQDPDLRKRLTDRAYENVQENWTIDRKGHLWHDIIERASVVPRIESLENTRFEHDPPPPPKELPDPAVTKGVVSVPDPAKEKRIVMPK